MNPIRLEILFDDKTAAGLNSVESRTDAMKQYIQQVVSALETEMTDLQAKFKQVTSQGLTGNAELAQVQALQGEIAKLKEQLESLSRVKKTTSETPINTSAAIKQANNLSFSIQQVARELPSLAMGPQMFFLAISNNLPILSDELKKAKAANDALSASGQKGVPIWKQVLSSIMSWQTAMVVGITLSVVYGKEIGIWIKNLFKSSDALDEATIAQGIYTETKKKDAEATKSANTAYGKQMATLALLRSEWNKLGNSLSEKKKYVKDNQSAFNELGVKIKNVQDAENLLVDNTDVFINAMQARAQAIAAQDTLSSLYKEKLDADSQAEFSRKKATVRRASPRAADISEAAKRSIINNPVGSVTGASAPAPTRVYTPEEIAEEKAKEYDKAADILENKSKQLQVQIDRTTKTMVTSMGKSKDLLNDANIDTDKGKNDSNDQTNYQETLNQARIAAAQKVEAMKISIKEEGIEKRKALLKYEYNNELREIDKNEKELLAKAAKGRKNKTVTDPNAEKEIKADSTLQKAYAYAKYQSAVFKEEQSSKSKLLEIYQGYFEKRAALKEKYDTDYANLKTAGASDEALAENRYQYRQADEELNNTFAQRSETFNTWADKVVDMSLKQLHELISLTKNELAEMEREDPYNPAIPQAKAKVTTLEKAITKRESSISPDKKSIKEWQELQQTLQDTSREFQQIGDDVGGLAGKFISAAGEIASSTISMISGIMTLADGTGAAIGKTGEAATAAMSTMEKASVILAIISAAMQIATKIAIMFTGTHKTQADTDRLNAVTDKLKSTNEAINKLIERRIELIKNAVMTEKQSLTNSTQNAIDAQLAYYNQQFKAIQNNWILAKKGKDNNLTLSDLGITSIEELKAFLNDASKIREWQNKGFSLRDYETFKNLVDGYDDLIEKSSELKQANAEAMSGLSVDDAKSSLDDLLLNSETTFDSVQDSLESHFRNAFLNIAKSNYLNGAMQDWYNEFVEATSSNGLSESEVTALRNKYNEIYTTAKQQIEDMAGVAGINLNSTSSQSGKSGSFASLTQEQGTKLEGTFTSVQDHTSGMHQLLKDMKRNNEEDSKILAQIAENTSYIKAISDLLTRVDQNGIKIKK